MLRLDFLFVSIYFRILTIEGELAQWDDCSNLCVPDILCIISYKLQETKNAGKDPRVGDLFVLFFELCHFMGLTDLV